MPQANRLYPSSWPGRAFRFLVSCTFVLAAPSSLLAQSMVASEHAAIPAGTVLPIVLRTTIAPDKTKQGQTVRGTIAQGVPLPAGLSIRKGSKVDGRVIEVAPAGNGAGARISIRFDRVCFQGQIIFITADLRAIAGFMEVLAAGVPNQAMGEGDVSNWMTTTQIGGDSVFGVGGTVTSAHNANDVVGKSQTGGGVLVQVRPNESGGCRGPINSNNAPQALWVFSSDACGTYGLQKVLIAHAGRTDPVGIITFELRGRKTEIHSGAGLLLRVIG